MFNLLPEKEKEKIQSLYFSRKTIVFLSLLCVVIITGGVLLIPSYIFVQYRNQDVEREIFEIQSQAQKSNRPELVKQLARVNMQVSSVNIEKDTPAYYDLVYGILELKPRGVFVTSLVIKNLSVDKNNNALYVTMTGSSLTRDDLITFFDALENSPVYKHVDVPISSLSKERDVDYVINFEIQL